MKRRLISLATLTVVSLLSTANNSCRVDAFSSPAQRLPTSRREGSSRWYRDTTDDGDVGGEEVQQRDTRRRFRSRTPRRQNRQRQQPHRHPASSFSQKLFTTTHLMPPLDVSKMPPPPKDLAKPYSSSNRFTSEMLTPSLRQRDDPHDESCLPTVCGPLETVYTNSATVVERWLADNVPGSGNTFVGFDVESVPNAPWIKQNALFDGPAVVQVSVPNAALVVHLTRHRNQRQSTACTAVSALLSDRTIIKCCTAIEEDMLELYRFNRSSYRVIRSRFDLGGVGSGRGSKQRIGLQRLVRAVLGVEMKKSKKLAMSNWSKPLTKQQIEYAARDAWAGAAVIEDLAERHPETFSADSIVRLLRDERPIQEVHKRATRRKKARTQLKTIREQYQQYSAFDLQYKPQKLGLPPIVLEELDRVREVLEETSPDGLIGFDAEPLGLSFDNQRN